MFGSSLRLPGSLLSDDPIDRQLLTAYPYTNFHRANEIRTAAQRALFKQNATRAVQAAGLARHRSQPRQNINAGRYDHGVAQQQFDLKNRLDWTRCRCSVTNANIVLDIYARMLVEVLE